MCVGVVSVFDMCKCMCVGVYVCKCHVRMWYVLVYVRIWYVSVYALCIETSHRASPRANYWQRRVTMVALTTSKTQSSTLSVGSICGVDGWDWPKTHTLSVRVGFQGSMTHVDVRLECINV